jgi:hypothetical protein
MDKLGDDEGLAHIGWYKREKVDLYKRKDLN